MPKKTEKDLLVTAEFARRMKRTESAITKAFRRGKFGDTAFRGPQGELLYRWPEARNALIKNTDPTRKRVAHVVADAAPRAVSRLDAEIEAEFSRVRKAVFAACAGLDGDARTLLVECLELASWAWSLPGGPLPGDHPPAWIGEAVEAWGPRPWLDPDEVAS